MLDHMREVVVSRPMVSSHQKQEISTPREIYKMKSNLAEP